MTIIGKILTFLIFFFSLLFLGFAITINNTNKDKSGKTWPVVADNLRKEVSKYQDDIKALNEENAALRVKYAELLNVASKKDADNDKEKSDLKLAVASAETARNEAMTKLQDVQNAVKQSQEEAANRATENQGLAERLKKAEVQIANLNADVTRARNKEVESKIALESALVRLNEADMKVRTLTAEIEQKPASGRGMASPGELGKRSNPPPTNVRGLVTEVTSDGLVQFNIGSDDGLQLHHTMEVYRFNPPEYVTKIQIIEIKAKEAVGRIVNEIPGRKIAVKKGDTVSSSILPTLGSK